MIYNGRQPWTAAEDVAELIAFGGEALARYQPSLRYYLLDQGRLEADDLPGRNLVSALIALETNRADERVPELLAALFERLRELETPELTQVYREWVNQVLVPRKMKGRVLESLPGSEEVGPMLQELVAGWVAEGREQGLKEGREQGIERGRSEERRRLCRQAALKFTAETGPRLSVLLELLTDPERLEQVGDWIIECATEEELLARVQDAGP